MMIKSSFILLCAVSVVAALQKSCSYEFMRMDVLNVDNKVQDTCFVNCHDCVDQTICYQVLNDLNLLDPNTTTNDTLLTISTMKNLCNKNINDNEQHETDCGSGGSCAIFCRMCRDLDICAALKAMINDTTSDAPYLLVSLNNKILNQCQGVTSNNASIHFPYMYLFCLILASFQNNY